MTAGASGATMWSRRSRFREACTWLGAAALVSLPRAAHAQACCAGGSTVTPARLAMHDVALVGVEAKAGSVLSSYDAEGRTIAPPPGAHEADLEQDVFAAARVLRNGQIALLVPFVETWRSGLGQSEAGGGVGDVNASVRYDFTLAGMSTIVPGLAAVAGVTFPSGRPADAAGVGALATGATGIGAWQFNVGVAVEQIFGPWLFNVTGIVARTNGANGRRRAHGGARASRAAVDDAAGGGVHVSERLGRRAERRLRARGQLDHRRRGLPGDGPSSADSGDLGARAVHRRLASSGLDLRQPAHPAAGPQSARGRRSVADARSIVDVIGPRAHGIVR